MKAWRIEAEKINARRKAGSKEPKARVQMRQARNIQQMFKPVGSGSWLLDGLLIRGGFKAAVYGLPIAPQEVRPAPTTTPSFIGKLVGQAKRWWNKH